MLTNAKINRLLPKPLFAWSKTFFDKSKATSSPDLSGFAKIRWQKNVLMTAQRDFRLGNSLSKVNTAEPNSSNRRTLNLAPTTQKDP